MINTIFQNVWISEHKRLCPEVIIEVCKIEKKMYLNSKLEPSKFYFILKRIKWILSSDCNWSKIWTLLLKGVCLNNYLDPKSGRTFHCRNLTTSPYLGSKKQTLWASWSDELHKNWSYILVSWVSEATPSATPFFKRAYKISHFPGL